MRLIAILANLVQMGIVLTVFLTQGISLGGNTILIGFLLLVFAFINLVALLFYAVNVATNSPLFGEEKPDIVKRRDVRVSYQTGPRPILIIGETEVPVLDLAENGARFSLPRNLRFKKRVRGEIALLCGTSIKVRGRLARREGDEATLFFKNPIPQATLLSERRMTSNV